MFFLMKQISTQNKTDFSHQMVILLWSPLQHHIYVTCCTIAPVGHTHETVKNIKYLKSS